ncbi:hypothetical protein [Scandinavium sp.]|nr:hypothetical protein [Scandinavium sp.]
MFVCTCQPFCQICQVGEFEGDAMQAGQTTRYPATMWMIAG